MTKHHIHYIMLDWFSHYGKIQVNTRSNENYQE